ncbi:hypothetical protein E1B28_006825 [Marasmius oreades]|uniref:Uncharacterized protein n=1 Tax=Marasmius oreades TaxID=181124 RepID=A0A9P7UWW4_9AGAR|nr:uncharacterized protein E1B28_006825 [Marasmius oreades]KAG7096152.1 hypothetical protein E1B28_006825 [Marasmius oreades]
MHSMVHYPSLILDFGAPNGVCSSITESRHISAVKRPWRRSNWYNALSQILLTNQQLDKLAAKRAVLESRSLLPRHYKPAPSPFETGNEDTGAVDDNIQVEVITAKNRILGYPRSLDSLSKSLNLPDLPWLMQKFLYEQIHKHSSDNVIIDDLPNIRSKVNIDHSAIARFRSLSNESGIQGMCQECIRASPSYCGHPRYDTVAVVVDQDKPGF